MDTKEIEALDIEGKLDIQDLNQQGDTETAHKMADEILCLMLRKLGCHKTVDEFQELSKWYS